MVFISGRTLSFALFVLLTIFVSDVFAATPSVRKFGWDPAVIEVGQYTNFHWDIRNVQRCYSTTSGPNLTERATSGTVGPVYGNVPAAITSKWYCIDLNGNRYPTNPNSYLEATRTIVSALHRVTAQNRAGASVSPLSQDVIDGNTARLTISAKSGYKIKSVSGCGGKLVGSTYTTGPVTADCNVDVSYYPLPVINQFEWLPKAVVTQEDTYFHWNISHVQHCYTTAQSVDDKKRSSSGIVGPVALVEPSEYISRWYCIDLGGNRFPANESNFIEAKRTVLAKPVVRKFEWLPATVTTGEETYFHWHIDNVKKCFTTAADPDNKERVPSGIIGPTVLVEPATYTSKWYCIDLTGKRFPTDPSQYLEAVRTVIPKAKPVKNQFEWLPAIVKTGEETYFHWSFENVQKCFTTASDPENKEREASGIIGPVVLVEPAVYTSKWYCIDLDGNRYPEDVNTFFEAKRTVIRAAENVVIYLHTDVLGSVIAESDSKGNIIKTNDYKPFGESKDNENQ